MVLPEARAEALRESSKCKLSAALLIFARVLGLTMSNPRRARDAVESETLASCATSCRVVISSSPIGQHKSKGCFQHSSCLSEYVMRMPSAPFLTIVDMFFRPIMHDTII